MKHDLDFHAADLMVESSSQTKSNFEEFPRHSVENTRKKKRKFERLKHVQHLTCKNCSIDPIAMRLKSDMHFYKTNPTLEISSQLEFKFLESLSHVAQSIRSRFLYAHVFVVVIDFNSIESFLIEHHNSNILKFQF